MIELLVLSHLWIVHSQILGLKLNSWEMEAKAVKRKWKKKKENKLQEGKIRNHNIFTNILKWWFFSLFCYIYITNIVSKVKRGRILGFSHDVNKSNFAMSISKYRP